MNKTLNTLTEDDLDALVSIAIRRAEVLDDARSGAASDAWREVRLYEEKLATLTPADNITGGIARVGAVRAALASGARQEAARLEAQYLDDPLLPTERRDALKRVFDEDRHRLADRFPSLAKQGRLTELQEWRAKLSDNPCVFPRVA